MADPTPPPDSPKPPPPPPDPDPIPPAAPPSPPRQSFFRKAQDARDQGVDVDPANPPLWVKQIVGGIVSGIVQAKTPPPDWLEPILQNQAQVAETLKEQTKPKHVHNPPQISAYNPRGDRDFPRPLFKCRISQAGVPLEASALSYDEIVLFNRLQPGEYWVRKTDGAEEKVEVVPTYNPATGDLLKLNLKMDIKDEAGHKKHGWPSLINLCHQILGEPEVHPPPSPRLRPMGRPATPGGATDLTDAVVAAQRTDIRDALTTMLNKASDAV